MVALIGLALFRPATLFGVDAKALGNSVGGEVRQSDALCVSDGPDHWRCGLEGATVGGVEYAVKIGDFGCWDGVLVAQPASASTADLTVSGCIGLTDMIGG